MKLNIGSGPKEKHIPGWINIDQLPDADVNVNLEDGKLPFPDKSVDTIAAMQVFEHIKNLIPLVNECHRVLKDDGFMQASSPMWDTVKAYSDPTHVRFFTTESWAYFQEGHELHETVGKSYGILPWQEIRQEVQEGWNLVAVLRK